MRRVYIYYAIIFVFASVLIFRMFYIQIYDDSYKIRGNSNSVLIQYSNPSRGYIFDRNDSLLVANKLIYNISFIPNEIKNLDTTEFCNLTKLGKLDLIEKIKKAKKYSRYKESILIKELKREDLYLIKEKLHNFKGFYIRKYSIREYKTDISGNIFGYIGEVNRKFLKKHPNYKSGDYVGISGIEKSYEKELKGQKGVKYLKKNHVGKIIGSFASGKHDTISKSGSNLRLTIDYKLQQYGDSLMQNKRGAIVAIEPSSGEILSLISAPSYSPKLLSGKNRSKNYMTLLNDSINKPLFDRALIGNYPPGSPFKLITALVGLQSNAINDYSTFTCHHGFHYGRFKMACHCGTSYPISVRMAISKSCNNFFSRTYLKILKSDSTLETSLDSWRHKIKKFGFGNYLNNDLSVGTKGFIPSHKFYDRWYKKNRWSSITVVSNAIGQGEVLSSPIQLANMTAIIANKGWWKTPHIVKSIGSEPNKKFEQIHNTDIKKQHFDIVTLGMQDVIEKGTARVAKINNIYLAGKTGTAQNPHGQDHSIFVAFAPVENPKIAIAVFVENGYWGSRWAAPIASLMIEKYLNKEVTRKYLEEKMLNGSLQYEYENQEKERLLRVEKKRLEKLLEIEKQRKRDSIQN